VSIETRCDVNRRVFRDGCTEWRDYRQGMVYVDEAKNGPSLDRVYSMGVHDVFSGLDAENAARATEKARRDYAAGDRSFIPARVHEFDEAVQRFNSCQASRQKRN